MYVKTLGFAPDLPSETPGIFKDCDGFVPSVRGMESIPSGAALDAGTLTATCVGLVTLRPLDKTRFTIAGTGSQIYQATNSGWSDITRASGTYSVGSDKYWTFSQYGNVSFAANKADVLQVFTQGDTKFADLTATMKASIVEVVNDFVFLFDTNEDTYGDQNDRWWCSGLGDHTNFTPSIQTQCATNRLTDTYGGIEAAKRLGDDIIAYKEQSMYHGRYIGPPFIWDWQLTSDEIGAVGPHSVVAIGDPVYLHLFIGYDDFYIFDGTRPRAIGTNNEGSIIAEWFFENLNHEYRQKIVGTHDRLKWRVYWFFPDKNSTGELNSYICYNYRSRRWGKGSLDIQFAAEYSASGPTYDDLGTLYATYDDLPSITYDTGFLASGQPIISYIGDDRVFYSLNGASGTNHYITGDVGIDGEMTLLSRTRPRFSTNPTSGTQNIIYRDSLGASDTTINTSVAMSGNSFDMVNEARWQSVKHEYSGDTEITGIDFELRRAGLE